MIDTLKNNLASIAALIAAIVAIGGGFTKYGEINTRLKNVEKFSKGIKQISEVDKKAQINTKEIELLKLQIREIKASSGNPLSN
jgi:hypothetical protein|tara:strand:- start:196 stop:447 length:252 start_codon:yes stop_codon:yes gene_type:complete